MVVMEKTPWTPDEEAILRRCKLLDMEIPEIMEHLHAAGYKRRHQQIRRKYQEMRLSRRHVPPQRIKVDPPISIVADRILLMADIHAPYHDEAFMTDVINLALRVGCTHCASLGDLIDFASLWWEGRAPGVELENEIESAREIMMALESCFKVIAIAGNHDERMGRMLQHRADLQTLAPLWMGPNITHSPYRWFRFRSGGEMWQAEHPANASVNATIVPKKLASIHLCHVVAGHGHEWGIARDVSGQFYAIDTGICADPEKLAYAYQTHSTRPAMNQGAALVLDGVPLLLSRDNIGMYSKMKGW